MERKLKFSEFAELIGVTAKTVYKMKDREQIRTVIERVNGREIQLVVTDTEEIERFRIMNGKGTDNNGNYEDILTDCELVTEDNNPSQSSNNITVKEMFDRIMIYNDEYNKHIEELNEKHIERLTQLNEEYNNRLTELNEELMDSKKQVILLEDKANREGLYLKEINDLKNENVQLLESKTKVKNLLLTVSVILLLVIVGLITFNVAQSTVNEWDVNIETKKNEPATQDVIKPAPQTRENS